MRSASSITDTWILSSEGALFIEVYDASRRADDDIDIALELVELFLIVGAAINQRKFPDSDIGSIVRHPCESDRQLRVGAESTRGFLIFAFIVDQALKSGQQKVAVFPVLSRLAGNILVPQRQRQSLVLNRRAVNESGFFQALMMERQLQIAKTRFRQMCFFHSTIG